MVSRTLVSRRCHSRFFLKLQPNLYCMVLFEAAHNLAFFDIPKLVDLSADLDTSVANFPLQAELDADDTLTSSQIIAT